MEWIIMTKIFSKQKKKPSKKEKKAKTQSPGAKMQGWHPFKLFKFPKGCLWQNFKLWLCHLLWPCIFNVGWPCGEGG